MKTLYHWEGRFTKTPSVIDCPEMRLISAFDCEPPVFVGPGHLHIKNSTDIEFMMFATPNDSKDAMRRLKECQEDPYDADKQFRLFAIDYEGTDWACGWTHPRFKGFPSKGWPLTGTLNNLVTGASGEWVSPESSVELLFSPKFSVPMNLNMITVTSIGDEEIQRSFSPGEQIIHALDTEIRVFHTPSNDSLWIIAKTSEKLRHPYTENWLSEPLRMLLGQPIYPRLVARNFGNGEAQVWLRPSPGRYPRTGIAALAPREIPISGDAFWELYAKLLTLIAEAKDAQGHPNFETHPLTRFFEEITEATHGSRWVLCMTLASAGEGLVRMLLGLGKNGKIDSCLKSLVQEGILVKSNQTSWTDVRHHVMHGRLVSPWGSKEEDQRIMDLADLIRRLTCELLRRKTGPKVDTAILNG